MFFLINIQYFKCTFIIKDYDKLTLIKPIKTQLTNIVELVGTSYKVFYSLCFFFSLIYFLILLLEKCHRFINFFTISNCQLLLYWNTTWNLLKSAKSFTQRAENAAVEWHRLWKMGDYFINRRQKLVISRHLRSILGYIIYVI